MKWQVLYAQSVSGKVWVFRFINKLSAPLQARVLRHLASIEKYGFSIDPKLIKKIDRNLYELRILGQEQIRIIFTISNRQIVLLHAIRKKSQKLPRKDIETAQKRM